MDLGDERAGAVDQHRKRGRPPREARRRSAVRAEQRRYAGRELLDPVDEADAESPEPGDGAVVVDDVVHAVHGWPDSAGP